MSTDHLLDMRAEQRVMFVDAVEHAAPIFLPFLLHSLHNLSIVSLGRLLAGAGTGEPHTYSISPRLERALLLGRSKLTVLARQEVYAYIFSDKHTCCTLAPLLLLETIHKEEDGYIDPFRPLVTKPGMKIELCKSCSDSFHSGRKSGQANVWAQLPQAFGLSSMCSRILGWYQRYAYHT